MFAFCLANDKKNCILKLAFDMKCILHYRIYDFQGGTCVSDSQKALDMALKQIEKQFGKGSIMKLVEKTDRKISTVPSGSLALDIALGVGGYPRGRVIEIYGPESS